MVPVLNFSLLGKPEIRLDGAPVTDFRTTKALALLCYLAVTQEPHSRDTLAGLLWSDDSEDKAKNSLRVVLSNLNKLFPHHLTIDRLSVAFQPDSPHALDVVQFEQLTRSLDGTQPDMATLAGAVALYRGDFLADLQVEGAPLFEEWLAGWRTYYRQQMLATLETLAEAQLGERQYGQAMRTLERLLALEPWHETAYRQLMMVHSRTGNFSRALALYAQCRRTLADELDVPPMPETQALYERIQAARRDRLDNLPHPTFFVGREAELSQIQQMISQPECRLLTITGLGGTGKSHLALAAARQANREQALLFLNGVVWVSLAGVASPAALPLSLADVLGLPLAGHTSPTQELLRLLRNKELLLILDNFEHLVDGGNQLLLQILEKCPDVKLLVTSREPLNLTVEWRLDLEGLAYPETANGALENYSAVQLFVRTARQVQPQFDLSATNAAQVQRLCQRVAGMPLALKLAAAWLRVISLDDVVAEVERGLDLLATQWRDVPPRQRSMRAIFDYTWASLTPEEARVMAALSVFRGGFTLEAARAVAGATQCLLAGLVDRRLVQVQHNNAVARYTIHELTRQYAAEQLQQASRARDAHSHYFAVFAQRCYRSFLHKQYRQAIDNLRQEIENLRTAWQWLIDRVQTGQQLDFAVGNLARFVDPMAWFYQERSFIWEGKASFQNACQAMTDLLDQQGERLAGSSRIRQTLAQLQIRLGSLHYQLAEYQQAEQILAEALPVVQDAEFVQEEALALDVLSKVHFRYGNYAEVKTLLRRCADLFQQVGSDLGAAQVSSILAATAANEGDYPLAEQLHSRAAAIFRDINYPTSMARSLTNLASTYIWQGNYTAAKPLLEEGRQIALAEDSRFLIMFTTSNLAAVAAAAGDDGVAEVHYRESLALARELGEQRWIATNLNGLARSYLAMNEINAAVHAAHEALLVAHKIRSDPDTLAALLSLAHVSVRRGEIDSALRLLTFIQKHPKTIEWDLRYCAERLDELGAERLPEIIAETNAWLRGKTLADVVAWIQETGQGHYHRLTDGIYGAVDA